MSAVVGFITTQSGITTVGKKTRKYTFFFQQCTNVEDHLTHSRGQQKRPSHAHQKSVAQSHPGWDDPAEKPSEMLYSVERDSPLLGFSLQRTLT